jgi:tetratricopeptide (TPR) repeat protein
MECDQQQRTDECDDVVELNREYLTLGRELKETRSRSRRRELKEHLDGLKIELGWALIDCGKPEEGLVLYRQLSWTTHGEIKCNGMARALTDMKCYDEARRILDAGLRRFPDSCMLWVGQGGLNASLGNYSEALKCFDMAIQCSSARSWEARYDKVIALEELGSYEEATEILDGLIEEYPEDPKFLAERGCYANEMGYPQDALDYFQGAMEIWKKNPSVRTGISIYAGLCYAYSQLRETRKAMEVALEGLKRFPNEDPVMYQNVGATFLEMGWKEDAREVLKEGVEKFPEDEDLRECFKNVNEDLDDPDGGTKPPILGLILLTALIRKRIKNKNRRP